MSFLAETVISLALCATSVAVMLLYRRLKNLGADLAAYRAALAESTAALNTAGAAVGLLVGEGKSLAITLALRIEEARALQARRPQPSPVNLKSVA
ncbi:MAG: hypothetical protein J0H94_09455 [Rhizobiales bacterium]|nr:hypothetical protein [Hyphomicrobiales bacterium]